MTGHANESGTDRVPPSRLDIGEILLLVLLVFVGAVSWWLLLRPSLQVDATPLAALPLEIAGWHGVDIPLEDDVTAMLRADLNVQRTYSGAGGDIVFLYIGYYGTDRGGRPEHTPEVCYPSAGWEIVRSDDLVIDPGLGLGANEMLIERKGERRLVQFWYRSLYRTGIHDPIGALTDKILNRLLNGRADGALVRVSMPLRPNADLFIVRSQLRTFATSLEPLLAEHWPLEREDDQG